MYCSYDSMRPTLTRKSEMFGTSEDEVPELDHSEDNENGKSD